MVTMPIALEHYHRLNTLVRDDVNAYIERFKRVGADEEEEDQDVSEEADNVPGDDAPKA